MIEALYEATSPSDGNNNGGRDSGVGRNTTGGTPTAARRPAWCASKILTAKEPDFTPWLKSLKKGTVDDRSRGKSTSSPGKPCSSPSPRGRGGRSPTTGCWGGAMPSTTRRAL